MGLSINIKDEQAKAQETVKAQGLRVLVCAGTGCVANGSLKVIEKFKELGANVSTLTDYDKMTIVPTGCHGFCEQGVLVIIPDKHVTYVKVKETDVEEIFESHIKGGKPVERLLYTDPKSGEHVHKNDDINFYAKQTRTALKNCGKINAESIEEAISVRGYEALAKVIEENNPDSVIDTITKSGLRGRGGGGFPTGMKWKFTAANRGGKSYVVCNGDEGDPGAFMDRSILEGDPHSIIEAMTIGGFCIGATKGLVYIRAEYPLAIQRLQIAIEQAREYGLLGKDVLGSGFDFDIELRYGAGAFVCGEETALIHSMEGLRGEPTFKPPFPAQEGYLKKPSNVNNVETFANIPVIINKGWEWFSSIGTEKSKGTKVFALAGQINNVGLIEVPMGITLREVIFEIGGGIKNGKKFKAVQTGGPSGGCLTEEFLDTPIDYDNLIAAGSMMGSGGMIVMDETSCMPAVARFYLDFTVEESCGKCTPCRVGNKRLCEILDKITSGKGTMEDLENLKNLSKVIKDTALCGLGQTSPNPVLSTISHFWDEYVAHVVDKKCPAGQCKALKQYIIDPEKCKGCTACARNCPVGAIKGTVKNPHEINQELCIKCGTCQTKCKFGAISVQ